MVEPFSPQPDPVVEGGTRPLRQARSRKTQERLMEAGAKLISERGYEGARVEDIARAAGCAVGTFYHRFRDKDAFFRALQARFCKRGRTAADALFSPGEIRDLEAHQLVTRFVENAVERVRRDQGLLRAMILRLGESPDLRAPMQELVRYMTGKLSTALVRKAGAIDHPDPPLAVAQACQFMMAVLFNILLTNPGPLELGDPRLPEELTRMFTAYLGLRPESE